VNQPQGFITLGDGCGNDSECDDVVDVFKRQVLGDHFLMNAVKIFVPAQNVTFQIVSAHLLPDDALDLFDVKLPLGSVPGHPVFYLPIGCGVKIHERRIFKLPFHPIDAEPCGNG